MLVTIGTESLRRTKWHEYAMRFVFGGAIAVAAGVIAKRFGPSVGGLFLAFPAIFPAAATLAQKHEIEIKQEKGLAGERRGVEAAGDEAAGSALGSIGLAAFAVIFWLMIQRTTGWIVLPLALLGWMVVSFACWFARKRSSLLRRR